MRLDRVGEIEAAAGVYAETKIEELAERNRFDKPEFAQEWDKIQRRERRHRSRLSRALKASARTLEDHKRSPERQTKNDSPMPDLCLRKTMCPRQRSPNSTRTAPLGSCTHVFQGACAGQDRA